MSSRRPQPRNRARTAAAILLGAALVLVPCAVVAQTSAGPSAPPPRDVKTAYIGGGLGLLPLLHVGAGYFATPRLLVDVFAGTYIFNLLVGAGVEAHLLGSGEQPRHALTVSGHLMANPLIDTSEWWSPGAETIGVGIDASVGYRYLSDGGFFFRATSGVLVYRGPTGLEAGPTIGKFTLGYAF